VVYRRPTRERRRRIETFRRHFPQKFLDVPTRAAWVPTTTRAKNNNNNNKHVYLSYLFTRDLKSKTAVPITRSRFSVDLNEI